MTARAAMVFVCWRGGPQVWELRTKKLLEDLPGHADEVYTVDWSPDGERVATGGKDRNLKVWKR